MQKSLFVTGCSGFIGRRLLLHLAATDQHQLYGLSRSPASISALTADNPAVHFIQGGLSDADAYATYLAKCDAVVHLAAATGKSRREEYFRVNAEGTRLLIDECRRAGVKKFLYVSTIAVKYTDNSNYYYAQSKALGEKILQDSGLEYAIVRPTIVAGENSASWESLLQLATVPIPLIFGDGTTLTQPIHVDDLVSCLLTILSEAAFAGETFELGGPEVLSFEELLRKTRVAHLGKEPQFILHMPLKPLTAILAGVEAPFFSFLPVTAGQLSAFANDGTARPNRIFDQHVKRMRTVDEIVVTK